MSYLEHYINKTQQPKFRQFGSIEDLIHSVAGDDTPPLPVQQPKQDDKSRITGLIAEAEKTLSTLTDVQKQKKPAKKVVKPVSEVVKNQEPVKAKQPVKESVKEPEPIKSINEAATLTEAAVGRYKMYRDRDEVFECNINVSGTTLSNASVRLICETEQQNILFYGKIFNDGRCIVPLKKMNMYPEGTIGKVKLEVVLEDVVFVPWEEAFVVEGAKKVTVELIKKDKAEVTVKPSV